MQKFTKTIGSYTIVADSKPHIKGYSNPEGKSLNKDDIWKNDVFYEQDYFQIEILNNLYVEDSSGNVCTPIIKEIEVKNSGYVCTWNEVFWVQGYAIINDQIYFIKKGEEGTYYKINPSFTIIKPGNENKLVEFEELVNNMTDVIESVNFDDIKTQMLL